MADTIRIRRDPDYFPILEGYTLRYEHTSNRFDGIETVEVVLKGVRAFRDDSTARAEVARERAGRREASAYAVAKTARHVATQGAMLGPGRMEFPLPPVQDKSWSDTAGEHELASLEAAIEVPAGRYLRCLRVETRFPGGTAIRYYAPGVGLVYEERLEGDAADRLRLVSFGPPKPRP